MSQRRVFELAFIAAATLSIPIPTLQGLEIFSEGFFVPESISVAPEGFGRFGGNFFIPDPGPPPSEPEDGILWTLPSDGGRPQRFASGLDAAAENPISIESGYLGGMFLPEDFGEFGGSYIVTSFGGISAFDPSGRSELLIGPRDLETGEGIFPHGPSDPDSNERTFARLTVPLIAPESFGDLGGRLLISYQAGFNPNREDFWGGVISVTSGGQVEHLVTPSTADTSSSTFHLNVEDSIWLGDGATRFRSCWRQITLE